MEWEAGAAVERLRAAGVRSVLLKGPAIATWLYDHGELRTYRDIDLLVSPSQFTLAIDVLGGSGYVEWLRGAAPAELGPKERELVGPNNVCIDLHSGIIGMNCTEERCWDILAQHTVPLRLRGNHVVEVLDVPARAMHLALHVAQNGPIDSKALADLHRGLARVAVEDWKQAASLAAALNADEAFAAGLRLTPEGALLADELSLTQHMTVELLLRTRSVTQDALFFARLAEEPSGKAKLALVARKIVPTAALLRSRSEIARRGRLGLVCAWLYRPVSLAFRLEPALRAWREARREAVGRPATRKGAADGDP